MTKELYTKMLQYLRKMDENESKENSTDDYTAVFYFEGMKLGLEYDMVMSTKNKWNACQRVLAWFPEIKNILK